ncbi:WD40 repeat protein [Xanthoria parietina]
MYWPMGAARIYSANSTRRKDNDLHDVQEGRASQPDDSDAILGFRTSRSGHLIATITATRMTIWQASPIVVLAISSRSVSSIRDYGPNVAVLLRPDASIAVVQTSKGFLVTYSLLVDPSNRVYQQIHEGENQSKATGTNRLILEQERAGLRELNIKFRMVIRIDAGIAAALTLDNEIIVATRKPAAVQCIKWTPDSAGRQTSTELISRMAWMQKGSIIRAMVYDRAMSLAVWITSDGRAYAVQRRPENSNDSDENERLFRGYGFHTPMNSSLEATHAAINARFSMLAIGSTGGEIHVYTARDYAGSIPLSHKIPSPASSSTTGQITCLAYSPDGYGLVAAYEHGWALWSVYGKPGASSFGADPNISRTNDECWLLTVSNPDMGGGDGKERCHHLLLFRKHLSLFVADKLTSHHLPRL